MLTAAAAALPAEQSAEFAAISVECELIGGRAACEEGAWSAAGERHLIKRGGDRAIAAVVLAFGVAPARRDPEIDVAGGHKEFALPRADKRGGAESSSSP